MVGTVRSLRNEAIQKQNFYILHFDLESNSIWVEFEGMTAEERTEAHNKAFKLPKGVRILDVWRKGSGKKTTGQTTIRFTKKGYIEESAIHLGTKSGRKFTLIFSPFLGTIKTYDSYVEINST